MTDVHTFAGETQGHNTYIVNCSMYDKDLGEIFHPYKSINGSTQLDYCIECRCDEV